jgi:hypothetical protein
MSVQDRCVRAGRTEGDCPIFGGEMFVVVAVGSALDGGLSTYEAAACSIV